MLVKNCCSLVMIRCADTGSVQPATGVIVKAAALLAALCTVNIELILVVVIIDIPIFMTFYFTIYICLYYIKTV